MRSTSPLKGRLIPVAVLSCVGLAAWGPAVAQQPQAISAVTTRNMNNSRNNANTSETLLNTTNVHFATFGKLFTLNVDDKVWAQPLFVDGLSIAGGTHDVIFIATANNTVFAFDANTSGAAAATPLWQRNFNGDGRPVVNTEVGQNCGTYKDMEGNIGITGTPVIDLAANRMFFVTRHRPSGFVQRLRAVDISTGNEVVGSTVIDVINPQTNHQHAGLALANGKVYVAWSSHCDTGPYNGRVLSFSASTLARVNSFNVTPGGSGGGIWMAGGAPVIDDGTGNLFYSTGNGSHGNNTQLGESLVKLSGDLGVLDFFKAGNADQLDGGDDDLGSAGMTLLPGTNFLTFGGKGQFSLSGKAYLVNMDNLGRQQSGDGQILDVFATGDVDFGPQENHHMHTAPVCWSSPGGLNCYFSAENERLTARRLVGTTLDTLTAGGFSNFVPPLGMPGIMLALSANGSASGSGIVWGTVALSGDANQKIVSGALRAWNAQDIRTELWSTTRNPTNDNPQTFNKGAAPLVVNGKVYVTSFTNRVTVYGLTATTEAETANATATAGRILRVASDPGYSRTQGRIMEGSQVNDFVEFRASVARSGNYGVRPRFKRGTNRAITQLTIDGVNQGTPQDTSGSGFFEADLGTKNLTAGDHLFRFRVTGKNVNSTSFWIATDYIKLAPR